MDLSNLSKQKNFLDTFWQGSRVLPRFARLKTAAPAFEITEVEKTLSDMLEGTGFLRKIRPGQNIAIAVGSRGIADLAEITAVLVEKIRLVGGNPFIVPAMGSQGQSTGAGQKEILASLGITAETVKAPIRSSMKVKQIGKTPSGVAVYVDQHAYHSDGIVVINRVKEHTDFEGPIQSGLMKMLAVGLGKAYGATAVHQRGAGELHIHIPEIGRHIIQNAPVLLGIGVVENSNNRLVAIRCTMPDEFEAVDQDLLVLSKQHTPRLPVDHLDVLVVRQIGKDISGTGMDTKTVGRIRIPGAPEPDKPNISRIVALDLTEASHGNATGIYLADICTRHLVSKIDFRSFYLNQLASVHFEGARIPLALSSDQEAIEVALCLGWGYNSEKLRAMVIEDTKHMSEMWVSESLIPELEKRSDLWIEGTLFDLPFDLEGTLCS